jgi:Na+/melibiose symporter-like transporter
MLVTRILDAVFDPLIGLVMDRTRSWLGKARPYLLYGCVPFGAALVATFAVPDWSPQARLIYAYASFTLLGLFYSIVYVPYSAMLPLMTADGREKVQLGSIRAMASSVGSIIVYGATLPIVAWAGGASRGYTLAATIMAVLMVACILVTVAVCRERQLGAAQPRRTPLAASLRAMITNRRWRVAFASAVLLFLRISVTVTSLIYFVKDVLERPQLIGIILPLFSIAILIGGGLSGIVFQRMDMRQANLISPALALMALAVAAIMQHSLLVFGIAFLSQHVQRFSNHSNLRDDLGCRRSGSGSLGSS